MDSTLISLLSDAGIASAVVVALMIAGVLVPKWAHDRVVEDSTRKDTEIERLQEALALERQRSNDTTAAGQVSLQLVKGLVKLAESQREHGDALDSGVLHAVRAPLDLGAEDIGL